MYLGTVIRRLREARGWSQEALAANIPNLHQSELSRIENNKKHPDWGQIEAFADAFDISVEELLQESKLPAPAAPEEEAEWNLFRKKIYALMKEEWAAWLRDRKK